MHTSTGRLVSNSQHSKDQSRWVLWLVGFGFLIALVTTFLQVMQVFSNLREQRAAVSDNVQWTLTQVEVEYLFYLNALEYEGQLLATGTELPPDLDEVRRRFDVFYSRVDTLRSAQLFAGLRDDPKFSGPLSEVTTFLQTAAPTIDATDEVLSSQIETIWSETFGIKDIVRDLSVSGLAYFAQASDERRAHTTSNLIHLAALSGGLLLTLIALSAYLLRVNQKTRNHGRELSQANSRMNAMLSTSLDAVIVVNSSGEVMEFSPAAETIFGYRFEDVIGKKIGALIVPTHLRDAHDAGVARMHAGGDRHVVGKGRVQLEAMRANGEIFPVELALQSAFIEDEEIIIGFIRDISRRVADEKELIATRDSALAGEKAKADFLTVMSHEIRTPLNGLLGNLALLRNTNLTKKQSKLLGNMDISGQILLNHVDTVLDIARFEAGKLSVVSEPTDLSTMLQDLVDGQSSAAASRGNTISWQWVGEAQPWVATDAHKLQQILLNLVGNAIKFTKDGRIQIELEVAEVDASTGTNIFEFRVIDTGLGIDEDELDAIFTDFHTSDPTIGRAAGGTGLGLGIARRFTEALGGDIGVESTAGDGSVFWFRLPLKEVASQQERVAKPARPQQLDALDLLVVEDNEINLEVICNMLEADGHKVTTATDGQLGVEAAAKHRFDAILMDISMPVMDGPTATHHIRSGNGLSANTPVVAVSANVLPDAVDSFRKAGMNAFIGKPISIGALRKALSIVTSTEPDFSAVEDEDPLATLKESLGDAVFDRLYSKFLHEGDAFTEKFKGESPQTSKLPTLAAECHKLAGSAAMFGAMEFRDVLIAAEIAATSDRQDEAGDLLHHACEVWEQVKANLPPAD